MAKTRQSEEVRIMNWFQSAPWAAAKTVGNLVNEIIKNRKVTEEPQAPKAAVKRKAPKPPKPSTVTGGAVTVAQTAAEFAEE
jgi:hypothetical protein